MADVSSGRSVSAWSPSATSFDRTPSPSRDRRQLGGSGGTGEGGGRGGSAPAGARTSNSRAPWPARSLPGAALPGARASARAGSPWRCLLAGVLQVGGRAHGADGSACRPLPKDTEAAAARRWISTCSARVKRSLPGLRALWSPSSFSTSRRALTRSPPRAAPSARPKYTIASACGKLRPAAPAPPLRPSGHARWRTGPDRRKGGLVLAAVRGRASRSCRARQRCAWPRRPAPAAGARDPEVLLV